MSIVSAYGDTDARLSIAVLDDPGILAEARRLGGAGDASRYLRARRFLERAARTGPGDRSQFLNYEQAAEYLGAKGRREDAHLVRQLARLTPRLADAEQQWRQRYETRPETAAQREDRHALAHQAESSWDEYYTGIDGMLYTPGRCQFREQAMPAVLAQSRAATELITGFESVAQARRWVRDDRCAADLRPLAPPPGVRLPRVAQEEQILAALLYRVEELCEVSEWLPATTFTADVRYEIFAAIRACRHDRHDSVTAAFGGLAMDFVTSETLRRLAWTPSWDDPRLGGPGTPLATVYLHRLASTHVPPATAARAARLLAAEDATAALATSQRTGPHSAHASARGRQVLHPRAGRAEVVSPDPARLALPPPSPPHGPSPTPRL